MHRLFARSALLLALSVSGSALGATYAVDPAHSYLAFRVGHLGISKVLGRFNEFSGTFTVDDASGALQAATIEAKTATVDTGIGRRDNHLKSADFFNAAQFPTIKFVSSSVRTLDDGRYELSGELTLHGVTKPVTMTIAQIGAGADAAGVPHVGAEGGFRIRRSDFGMTNMLDSAGDDVELIIGFEGIKQ